MSCGINGLCEQLFEIRKVPAHRCFRRVWVAGTDRVNDPPVFGKRHFRTARQQDDPVLESHKM